MAPLLSSSFLAIFRPLWRRQKTYVVNFRSHNDDRPAKFIVVGDRQETAINMAWKHGGPDFQARFDQATAQAQEMKEGASRCCEGRVQMQKRVSHFRYFGVS